jgi:hypothetical protein
MAPENTFKIEAVASAMPSIRPTDATVAPKPETKNSGSTAWIISLLVSLKRLVKPRIQIFLEILIGIDIAAVSVNLGHAFTIVEQTIRFIMWTLSIWGFASLSLEQEAENIYANAHNETDIGSFGESGIHPHSSG